MRRPLLTTALICSVLVVALARCASCSEECSGPRQGSEGCPCQTDQDCTTVGAVLLCESGSCAPGDPPDAHGAVECNSDGDCDANQACGADATCQPAPACQRLEPAGPLGARSKASADVVVFSSATVSVSAVADAPQASCGIEIQIEDPALTVTGYFTRDGELEATGCVGRWFAAHRAGFVECQDELVALANPGVQTCLGAECAGADCRALGAGEMGVCP